MRQVIISTIGTSLLTQQLDRSNLAENTWYSKLRDTANLRLDQTPQEVLEIVQTLKSRAIDKLKQGTVKQIRSASAELNGIYGLYQEQLDQGHSDMHWLIATDTAQGKKTADIVEQFLREQGLTVQIYTPKGLSAVNTRAFTEGVDNLLTQLESMTQGYDRVCFNLVGGFKSLQAYLNTIGMFYADELIYIFEGANSEVIKIPRLPIKVDYDAIAPYTIQFALMAVGAEVQSSEVRDVQEALLFSIDSEVTLSNWGKLIWNQAKHELLSGDLLNFPRLDYQASFNKDYANTKDSGNRVRLQEALAKASHLLVKHQGDTAPLKKDGGLLYETYQNKGGVGHFRVTQSLRVSCTAENGKLQLRHYGAHDYVNDNP